MELFQYGDPNASAVLIQPVDDRDLAGIAQEAAEIRKLTDTPFCLKAVRVQRWNHELSPWEAPAVFGSEPFGGGAQETLSGIRHLVADPDKSCYIGGYSLAGLFALWAVYQTDLFRGAAAASPSVWFPDFTGYMQQHRIRCPQVYLSLGDRESRTKNAVMATVGDKIREAYALLNEQGVRCELEWNPGNHFRDAELRTAKAFAWLLRGQ